MVLKTRVWSKKAWKGEWTSFKQLGPQWWMSEFTPRCSLASPMLTGLAKVNSRRLRADGFLGVRFFAKNFAWGSSPLSQELSWVDLNASV